MLSHAAHSWQCRVNTCHAFTTWIWIQSTQARHPACEAHQNARFRLCLNMINEGWSCAACPLQRFLYSILSCFLTTAGSAQFCLLCCQPEPVPESLPARPPSLTRRCPCSLPVWSGQPIHMVHRTYSGPRHSISQTPLRGTERCDPPQIIIASC